MPVIVIMNSALIVAALGALVKFSYDAGKLKQKVEDLNSEVERLRDPALANRHYKGELGC